MSLAGTAKETLQIVKNGGYVAPSGREVSIEHLVERAVSGTRLFRPEELREPLVAPRSASGRPVFEVTPEKTGDACRRLVQREGATQVLALNFASAKNPGGGFLGGAKAQEEDLARCSALYRCQVKKPDYYSANRACGSMLYTDHLIYSPDVPFFRDDQYGLLEEPFCVSVITSPAPNAGQALLRDPEAKPAIVETLERRTRQVLQVAAKHGHRVLVFGAWGCGVFRNDPVEVARVFDEAIAEMAGCFERIVFAVWERNGDGPNLRAFRARFGASAE